VIVVVGGGLAGLSAAQALVREGRRDVLVLDPGDGPGGRVRTIEHEGFLLDAGFQVGLDSYPAFRSILPLARLEPCYFDSGALVEDSPGQVRLLANPLRHPGHLGDAIASRLSWEDRIRLVRLVLGAVLSSDVRILAGTGDRTRLFLLESGFSDDMIRTFFEPFFGGIFLDPDLETDSSLLRYYLKMFATGRAFVPRGGMGRMGDAMAECLPPGTVRYESTVTRIERRKADIRLHLRDGRTMNAEAVVVAADPRTTCELLQWRVPAFRSTRVVYMQSARPVYEGGWLVLPARNPRFAQHFVQLSNIDPSLAPEGRHLLSATVLNDGHLSEGELYAAVKAEVTRLFPDTGRQLQPLRQIHVPRALPAQVPGFRSSYRSLAARLPTGIHLAGDLAGNASLQNALESGHRAALRILEPGRH
jgi:protoporphyrinogen oxidase